MPKVGTVEKEQIRDSVWAAAARTLTALTGQPRTDLVGADNALWAHASRTLTAFNAQALFDLPIMDSVYPGVAPVTSATANAWGSWMAILANVGIGKRLIGVVIMPETGAADVDFELELGEGAAAAESAIARVSGQWWQASNVGFLPPLYFPLWRKLTDNARLSVRARHDQAASAAYKVNVLVA